MYIYTFDYAALSVYLLLIVYYFLPGHIRNASYKSFGRLLFAYFGITLFDILGTISINQSWPVFAVYTFNMLYYLAESLMSWIFIMYVIGQLEYIRAHNRIRNFFLHIPIVFMTVAILSTPFTNLIFSYSAEDGWTYGPWRILTFVEFGLYFIWAVLYVHARKSEFEVVVQRRIILFSVINVVVCLIQLFHHRLLLKGFGGALALMILMLGHIANEDVLDKETGLANRKYLRKVAKKFVYNRKPFYLILVRIGDYDLLVSIYGVDAINRYTQVLGKKISALVERGFSFVFDTGTYALLMDYDYVEENGGIDFFTNEIYSEVNVPIAVESTEIVGAFFVTEISYPDKAHDLESMSAYATYFHRMHRMRYGVVNPDELQTRDKLREQKVINAIRAGLTNNTLEAYYQPICTSEDQKFVTCEALARLYDPELGFIPPDEFILYAEENGLIIPLGYRMIELVCELMEKEELGKKGVEYVEINLSVVQCLQRDFIDELMAILNRHGISPEMLCLEITETASNCAPEVLIDNLKRLKELGFKLALDDFGKGYASLDRLMQNEFDVIKFDKSVIQKAIDEKRLREVFSKLPSFFHSMDAVLVAEGVETKEHYDYLKSVGCDYIQGYYFSKPLPKEKYIEFLKTKM